eukprot:2157349-Pyramimonas_sp.AAC.2
MDASDAPSGRGGLSLNCARPASEAARSDSGDDGDDAHAPLVRSSPPRAQRARLVDGALQRRACTARGSSRGRRPSCTISLTSTRRYRRRSTSARAAGGSSDRRWTPWPISEGSGAQRGRHRAEFARAAEG